MKKKKKRSFLFCLLAGVIFTCPFSAKADDVQDTAVTDVSVVLTRDIPSKPIENPGDGTEGVDGSDAFLDQLASPSNSVVRDKLSKDAAGNTDYYGTLPQTGLAQEKALVTLGFSIILLLMATLIGRSMYKRYKEV